MPRRTHLALVFILAVQALPGLALDLGRHGPVYPIREPDFLESIAAKVKRKVDSGEWAKIEKEARERALATLANPPPVAGMRTASAPRSWLFDPSVVLSQAIVDNVGRVLFPAGTRVNPLDTVTLSEALLFLDGRDRRQVTAATAVIERRAGAVKPILVAGSWQDLGRSWGRQVFFDQDGEMVRHLGIQAVPALVTQEGRALRIEEFAP